MLTYLGEPRETREKPREAFRRPQVEILREGRQEGTRAWRGVFWWEGNGLPLVV
jgi:hypothetical protein